jgi:hypothetical protein
MNRILHAAVVFVLISAGSAAPVLAQSEYRGTPADQAACKPDVFRLCAGEIPSVRKITACLRRNMARLNPGCAAVFANESR